jgi:hypothetical protein
MHPRNIRGQPGISSFEAHEAKARLHPYFLPYDGLGIACDKVLGELFL